MNIKVFGGSGFIGSHLVKRLASEGHHVTVVDLKKPRILGANVYDPAKGDSAWYNPVKFIGLGGDITKYRDVNYAIDRNDYVVNLAAVSLFSVAETFPQSAVSVNICGAANVLRACIENNAAHLVFASTGAVYPLSVKSPICEDFCVGPVSLYGKTKLWAEEVHWHYEDKQSFTILRLPHVIGPGKTWGANSIIAKMLANERPTIFGDGLAVNDFTYVEDIVQAICLSLQKSAKGLYNIGTGEGHTAIDFFKTARASLDKGFIEPIYAPPRRFDMPDFRFNISKAKKDLGYNPKYNLDSSLQKTCLEWYQWL